MVGVGGRPSPHHRATARLSGRPHLRAAARRGSVPSSPVPSPQDGGGGPEGLTAQRVGSLAAGLVTNLPEHRGDGAAVPGVLAARVASWA